jgi:hypothetical protein
MNHNLGVSIPPPPPVENVFEIVKPKPDPVHSFVPNTPIFLTTEQWNAICDQTKDATIPFKVEVTIINKEEGDQGEEEQKEENDETPYVPKKPRKNKKYS